jgi:hypothetical protein
MCLRFSMTIWTVELLIKRRRFLSLIGLFGTFMIGNLFECRLNTWIKLRVWIHHAFLVFTDLVGMMCKVIAGKHSFHWNDWLSLPVLICWGLYVSICSRSVCEFWNAVKWLKRIEFSFLNSASTCSATIYRKTTSVAAKSFTLVEFQGIYYVTFFWFLRGILKFTQSLVVALVFLSGT